MPIRSCMICRCKKEKKDLIRIVADENEKAIIDKNQVINKRGIYFCNDINCLTKCKKLLNNSKFRTKIKLESKSLEDVIDNIIELGE